MNIFVASTYSDLKNYRDAAQRIIQGLGHRAELVERLAGVDPHAIAHLLRSILRTCHGCVLIVGSRRGSGPLDKPDAIDCESYTMIEFLESIKANVPLIPFFVESTADENEIEREWVARFRDKISSHSKPISISSLPEFESHLSEQFDKLVGQNPVNPSERETRTLDRETFHQIFGEFKEGALEFITDAAPGDRDGQRNKALLQGYPRDTATAEFKLADIQNTLGWLCHEQREYAESKEHYERALAICPSFPLVWNNKGLAHYRLGELELSKQCYFNALQFATGFVKPWSNLAFLYWAGFQDADATRRWLDRAYSIAPNYPDARTIEIAMEQVAKLEPQATSEMDRRLIKLLKHFPRETISFGLPGMAAMMQGNHALAIQGFQEARKTAMDVVEFVNPIAECLCHLGQFADAEPYAREAVERDATYAPAWVNLSWACCGQGDFQSAQSAARRALALEGYPDTVDAALSNGVIASCQMGDFPGAMTLIDDFAPKHPVPQRVAVFREHVANQMRGER